VHVPKTWKGLFTTCAAQLEMDVGSPNGLVPPGFLTYHMSVFILRGPLPRVMGEVENRIDVVDVYGV